MSRAQILPGATFVVLAGWYKQQCVLVTPEHTIADLKALPRHFLDTFQTLPRHFLDTIADLKAHPPPGRTSAGPGCHPG